MNSRTFSQSSAIALLRAILILTGAVGCGRISSPETTYFFKTPALEVQLTAYSKALMDNGLTTQEAEVIVNRARMDANNSSWQTNSDLPTEVLSIVGIVTGSIKALGKTSFGEEEERKLLAMTLIARLAIESGNEQLAGLSESETQEVIAAIAEGQIFSSQLIFLSTVDSKIAAYQVMTDSILEALETTAIPAAYHAAVSEKVATSTVSHLDEVGLSTTAVQELIPLIVGNTVKRFAASAGEDQDSKIVRFISSTLAQIDGLGLSPAQISSIKTGITSESTASLQKSPISGTLANQIIGDIAATIENSVSPPTDESPPKDNPSQSPTPD